MSNYLIITALRDKYPIKMGYLLALPYIFSIEKMEFHGQSPSLRREERPRLTGPAMKKHDVKVDARPAFAGSGGWRNGIEGADNGKICTGGRALRSTRESGKTVCRSVPPFSKKRVTLPDATGGWTADKPENKPVADRHYCTGPESVETNGVCSGMPSPKKEHE